MRVALLACCVLFSACSGEPPAALGGDPGNGRLLLRQFGCGGCHHIPGVAAARGEVGPPLDGVARRAYLAGVLPNTPPNLARWIADPRAIEPRTAMPDMQASDAQVRDMVAYLLTLE